MSEAQKILLIGFGNMGKALVRGWLARGRSPATIYVADALPVARDEARKQGLQPAEALVQGASVDIVVLAMKPQQLSTALDEYRHITATGTTVLSIVAGKHIAQIVSAIGNDVAVVRAMPNTPAAISQGMTVLCASESTSFERRALCEELMSAVGTVEWVDDESFMDAVTAVSGSGPAYVFLMIECLAEAGVQMGLAPELSMNLAIQTIAGSGAYARESSQSPGELRRSVSSPGGTTAAALEVLMGEEGMARLMSAAVRAATERSKALSKD